MASEEHMRAIERHYQILGMDNPHQSHYDSIRRSRGTSKTGGALGSGAESVAKERSGGLGSGKGGSSRYENTSAADRKAANSDNSFGYFDEVNKRYVPAFIDMIDGGGRNTRGDEFVGGPLSGVLNQIGIDPYGSQRERMFVSPNTSPIVQAVSGAVPRPQIRPNRPPAPSYATMDMGEAGRGSMPADTPLPYANMNMGEAGRGSMPSDTPLPYGTMDMGEAGRGSLPNPFSGPSYDMPVDPRQQMNIEVGAGVPLPPSQATADEGFNRFLTMARNDPNMSFLMNDLPMAKSVYERMVASGTRF